MKGFLRAMRYNTLNKPLTLLLVLALWSSCSLQTQAVPLFDKWHSKNKPEVTPVVSLTTDPSVKRVDLLMTTSQLSQFQTFNRLLSMTRLATSMKWSGPFTVFAPTDEAFAKMPEGTMDSLLKPQNKQQLMALVKAHVMEGAFSSRYVQKMNKISMLDGEKLQISRLEGLHVGPAKLIQKDIQASNGIIHGIDAVLIPPKEDVSTKTATP
jgi:uncharacterized surface protein with fasciclin (FAS1) repeats